MNSKLGSHRRQGMGNAWVLDALVISKQDANPSIHNIHHIKDQSITYPCNYSLRERIKGGGLM